VWSFRVNSYLISKIQKKGGKMLSIKKAEHKNYEFRTYCHLINSDLFFNANKIMKSHIYTTYTYWYLRSQIENLIDTYKFCLKKTLRVCNQGMLIWIMKNWLS
jgi:alkyl sulfatase BDS1-like metallo-beta-lactamase superfamily hydrolase